ncbi:FAD-dependent oxidoreductase [Frigidibacter sp. MR17.14]|uniref:NAD(P)/FAD-dependent oxidoreductase n=1 Tax=Frigidibacter sp. MR17.14 TaxID=3126509 RepID=UPI003012FA28
MERHQERIAVIGGGVIGLATALRLRLDGHAVLLIEPNAPGSGSSAGNPGGISVSSTLPAAAPGVLAKVPGWILDPDGPLTIRPGQLPRMAGWLARFLRAATPERYAAGIAALSALTREAVPAWTALLEEIGQGAMIRPSGTLIVYRSAEAHAAETASWERRARLGLSLRDVTADEIRAAVPALAPRYDRGRMILDNAQLSDPLEVCRALATAFTARGGEIRTARVRALTPGAAAVRLDLDDGALEVAQVVIAAGARSAPLARMAGDRVPLQSERGYSLTYADSGIALTRPVFSPSEKIMAAPVAGGLRFAGTAEFAGLDAAPNWRRAASLERLGRQMFPGLPEGIEPARWTGDRPSTPDGLPAIGRSARSDRVLHAFGHGHIGMTTAAVTAQAVAALVRGRVPPLDLSPYAPDRFRGV